MTIFTEICVHILKAITIMETRKESYESPCSRILVFENQGVVCQTVLEPIGEDDEGEW